MTWEGYEETSDVKVIHQGEASEVAYLEQKQRTAAQKLQDQLLDTATESFTDALGLIETGLEALVVLGVVPQHKNLTTLLGQQIAQVAEIRRIRG